MPSIYIIKRLLNIIHLWMMNYIPFFQQPAVREGAEGWVGPPGAQDQHDRQVQDGDVLCHWQLLQSQVTAWQGCGLLPESSQTQPRVLVCLNPDGAWIHGNEEYTCSNTILQVLFIVCNYSWKFLFNPSKNGNCFYYILKSIVVFPFIKSWMSTKVMTHKMKKKILNNI